MVPLSTRVQAAAIAWLTLAGLAAVAAASQPAAVPPLDRVLALAGDYIAKYEHDVTAVVAQEDYQQRVLAEAKARRLRSDLIMIADEANGWVEFRDVFEVDGQQVRDHDDRVVRLFMKPNPNARAQTERIVRESARFNLNPNRARFNRTLNIPMTALRYLRRQNQPRSRFEAAPQLERTDAGTFAMVRFKEESKPRLIGSRDDPAASGLFWIDPASGAVARSELKISSRVIVATLKVAYTRQSKPALWLPATMDELYILTDAGVSIDGHATYSNFRQFRVDVSTDIK
jgi:hypothetical protein